MTLSPVATPCPNQLYPTCPPPGARPAGRRVRDGAPTAHRSGGSGASRREREHRKTPRHPPGNFSATSTNKRCSPRESNSSEEGHVILTKKCLLIRPPCHMKLRATDSQNEGGPASQEDAGDAAELQRPGDDVRAREGQAGEAGGHDAPL